MKFSKLKYVIGAIVFFSCLGFFSLYSLAHFGELSDRMLEKLFNYKTFLAVMLIYNGLGLSFCSANHSIRSFNESVLRDQRKIMLLFFMIAFSILVFNALLFVTGKWILGFQKPFSITYIGTKSFLITWLIEMVVFSLLLVTNYYRNLTKLYQRNAELEESESKSQYYALQNQLNPHFLFNSLNTLIAEIEYDKDNAIEFTRNLSDVYRYVLQCQYKKTVSLKSELDFLDSFIFLHTVRLGDCITISNELDDSVLDAQLPSLTLQLLFENIFKHNVISFTRPMTIRLYTEEDNKWLCISNPIRPKKDVTPSGKGLMNLAKRYELLSGQQIQIMNDNECFTVKVPLFL